MTAILATKLGMTQRFLEDGTVERVTVLEAGPCPVTAIRNQERDGYSAVQLAFGATKEKHLTKPELGHLKKAGVSAHKHLVEFRDEGQGLQMGDTVTADVFSAVTRSRSPAPPRARASRAPSSATTSLAAPRPTARTTTVHRARSAPPPGRPA